MSDTNGKIKTYKNAARETVVEQKPYVPQYQVHGVEPQEYHGNTVVPGASMARPTRLSLDNPRAKRSMVRQPYADAVISPLGRGKGMIPNVGNNVEHTWSGDGDLVDDLFVDQNHPMVDNNDYVSPEVETQMNHYQSGLTAADIQKSNYGTVSFEETVRNKMQPVTDDLLPIVADLASNSYLLIVGDTPICSGPIEEIEEQARALVFGEHEMCDGNPIPVDDIIILKRVKVKVGLFLE